MKMSRTALVLGVSMLLVACSGNDNGGQNTPDGQADPQSDAQADAPNGDIPTSGDTDSLARPNACSSSGDIQGFMPDTDATPSTGVQASMIPWRDSPSPRVHLRDGQRTAHRTCMRDERCGEPGTRHSYIDVV
jgi:hypothetical protein